MFGTPGFLPEGACRRTGFPSCIAQRAAAYSFSITLISYLSHYSSHPFDWLGKPYRIDLSQSGFSDKFRLMPPGCPKRNHPLEAQCRGGSVRVTKLTLPWRRPAPAGRRARPAGVGCLDPTYIPRSTFYLGWPLDDPRRMSASLTAYASIPRSTWDRPPDALRLVIDRLPPALSKVYSLTIYVSSRPSASRHSLFTEGSCPHSWTV